MGARGNLGGTAMRQRSAIFFLVAPLIVLIAFVALGQPKGKKDPDKEKAEPAPEAPPAAAEAGAAAPASTVDDLGPPPPAAIGDGGPSASPLNPRPNEFPDGGAAPPPPEFDKLLGDIAALRARVAAVTTTLFASKLRIIVQTDDSDDARIQSFVVTLDDGVVYRAPARFSADDEKIVYEHAVAPGHHVIGVEVERTDVRNKSYQTWQASRFSVVVPESKKVEAHLELEDDSDMAEDFPDGEDGEYELNVRMRARVIED